MILDFFLLRNSLEFTKTALCLEKQHLLPCMSRLYFSPHIVVDKIEAGNKKLKHRVHVFPFSFNFFCVLIET